jgi:xylitol oxidase
MGSLPHISVAGACSTGTHGSGVGNGCLSTGIVGVELVTGTGDLVTGLAGEPDFPGMVLALGSLGVVTRLAVALEPTYDVGQEVVLDVPVRSALDRAAEILGSAYSVSLFLSFRGGARVDSVWLKHRAGDGSRTAPDDWWGGRPAQEAVHPILGIDAGAATDQLGSSGPWHERLPHFRASFTPSVGDEIQSEFFVPLDRASEVLAAVVERSGELARAVQVMEIRAIAADDLWLSPFRDRETLAVHATWVSDLAVVRPALEVLQVLLAPFQPRPHWGKYFLGFDRDWVESTYPGVVDFRDLGTRLDPERRFVNDYVEQRGVR